MCVEGRHSSKLICVVFEIVGDLVDEPRNTDRQEKALKRIPVDFSARGIRRTRSRNDSEVGHARQPPSSTFVGIPLPATYRSRFLYRFFLPVIGDSRIMQRLMDSHEPNDDSCFDLRCAGRWVPAVEGDVVFIFNCKHFQERVVFPLTLGPVLVGSAK